MNGFVRSVWMCAAVALGVTTISTAIAQPPVVHRGEKAPTGPRRPGGLLRDELGVYLTIEGVKFEGPKIETGTLLVDTVNGVKLDRPVTLQIRGAYIANYNLQPATVDLPAQQRCVLKGFESGEMVGTPPAVEMAAIEQGWTERTMSQAVWHWRTYFVALVLAEPKGLVLRKH